MSDDASSHAEPVTLTEPPTPPSRPVVVGALLGVVVFTVLTWVTTDFRAEEQGLGLNTHTRFAHDDQGRISGYPSELPELARRIERARAEGRPSALWLGGSQLHAINAPQEGDTLAVVYANRAAEARGSRRLHLQVSAPNANLQELWRVYQGLREARALPDDLVLALTYDDLDEPEVRPGLLASLETLRRWRAGDEGTGAAEPARLASGASPASVAELSSAAAPVARSATAGTPQEALETALTAGLERAWPAYAGRHRVRSRFVVAWRVPLMGALYRLVGRAGNRVDPEPREANHAALEELLRSALQDGVRVLIYRAPHRPGEARFYHHRPSYDAYWERAQAAAHTAGAETLDLETLVPAEVWGLTNNHLPDVFHFQDAGHERLGQALDAWFAAQPGPAESPR